MIDEFGNPSGYDQHESAAAKDRRVLTELARNGDHWAWRELQHRLILAQGRWLAADEVALMQCGGTLRIHKGAIGGVRMYGAGFLR